MQLITLVLVLIAAVQGKQAQADTCDAAIVALQPVDADYNAAGKLMEGFFMGIVKAEFPNLEHCVLKDSKLIAEDIRNATDYLKQRSIRKVIDGLKIVGKTIYHVWTMITHCKGIKGDYSTFAEAALIFMNPEFIIVHIGRDILIHGVDIYNEVKKAIQAAKDQDYYEFGLNFGKAASHIFIGEEYQILLDEVQKPEVQQGMLEEAAKTMPQGASRQEMADIMQGFLESADVKFNYGNLLACVQVADNSALELYEAGTLLEEAYNNTDIMDKLVPAIGGLTFGFLAVETFIQQGLPVCEAIDTSKADFSKINQAFENIKKDHVRPKFIGRNIIINGHLVNNNIYNSIEAFHDGKYHEFGEIMGQLVLTAADEVEEGTLYLY